MSSKVQPISGMEDTASVASTVTPKVSLFAKKTGFVIPKNKLSGSLVPVFRGTTKPGGADLASEESTKQVLRKTKWGPDLTQDAFVRKCRASAYQTRLDQITQLLEARNDHDSLATQESAKYQKSELELERNEIIGEIVRLNPSFKVPTDYKPLLKEEKVAIPIKEYPGRNFIGLIFGPAGDTQKRLERETGAKIRVYGIKVDTMKETDITSSDGNESHSDYEELYVLVTAETFEKVDAAVSLIQLLITPVLANTVSVSTNDPVSEDNQNLVNQGVVQSTVSGSAPTPPVALFQPYPNQWAPLGQSSGFTAPPFSNLSAPSNSAPMSSSFGPRGSVPHNQQPIFQHPTPTIGYPGPPRNSLPPLHVSPRQPNFSSPPFTPAIPNQNIRPMGSPIGWSQSTAGSPGIMRPNIPQNGPSPPVGLQTRPPNTGPDSWFPSPTTSTSMPPQSIRTPPITSLRPQQPVSNDFTFQTHRSQTPTGSQFMPLQSPQIRLPQSPSFRPGMNNHGAPPVMQGFNRPQNIQMGQHQGPSVMPPPPDRHPFFPGHGQRPPASHVGPRQFGPGPGPRSPAGPFPHRPGNFLPVQQNQNQNNPSTGFRPQNFVAPLNQQFRGNVPFSLGRPGFNQPGPQQVYDPFSPTDVGHKPGNHQNSRKQDNDPEYDDLMASVGVK